MGKLEIMPGRNVNKDKAAYFNRELSWLAFNRRVLEQAEDERFPLAERVRFLTFVGSNLDEFFEIRVSGLIQQVESDSKNVGLDGLGPKEQLRRIRQVVTSLIRDAYELWHEKLVPALAEAKIVIKPKDKLTKREVQWLKVYFEHEVMPVLTPLAIDPTHPFPSFPNKTLNLLLWLDDPDTPEKERMLAFIPVPRILPRVVRIPGTARTPASYVFLSDVIKLFAQQLFPGYHLVSAHAFRITRNSDLYIDEEEVENLLQYIQAELYNLRKGAAVRLEIEDGVEDDLLQQLLNSIKLPKQYVYRINGPLNLMRLGTLVDLIEDNSLKFKPFQPYTPPSLRSTSNLFDVIRQKDQLLHHPYDSFDPVVNLVQQASVDPKVLAIKITLYRTSSDSPIAAALIAAARNNKQVTVLIELKARFDEANNINWAKQMEEAGVHVVYGFVGLKTHCKCMLIVRREERGLQRYAHLGTGNYHPRTAKLYTDLSFFTTRDTITCEVADVFNTLTGFAKKPSFDQLMVAPFTLHRRMNHYIQQEARNAKKGLPARIIVKCNSLINEETIGNLYKASQAGVKIDCIVRGICGLVPGVPDMSENITVRSILGRFLEHSRIYYFENAAEGRPLLFAGSADWMDRNFYRRIEVIFPIEDDDLRQRIFQGILEPTLKDNAYAKFLQPNGAYLPDPTWKDADAFSSQNFFIAETERKNRIVEVAEGEDAAEEE